MYHELNNLKILVGELILTLEQHGIDVSKFSGWTSKKEPAQAYPSDPDLPF